MEQQNLSFWQQTPPPVPPRAALAAEETADVLVVGGGIAGVCTAWQMAERGIRVTLIEAGTLGCGATGRSTGKVSVLHSVFYSHMPRAQTAAQVARTQDEAVRAARNFAMGGADCGFAESAAHLFARNEKEREAVEREYEALRRAGLDASLLSRPDFPPGCVCAAQLRAQLVIHPMRFLWAAAARAEALGARIFEHTRAVRVHPGKEVEVLCESGARIRARHLVQATQYPFFDDAGLFFTRLYPHRSYVVAVVPENTWPAGNFVSAHDPVRSLRTAREGERRVLLAAGDGHETGRDAAADARVHFEALRRFAGDAAGEHTVCAQWSSQDYDTPDGIPFIGPVRPQANVYVAAGFGRWGLASGVLAGMVLADWVTEGESARGALYNPARLRPAGAAHMAGSLLGQAGAFLRGEEAAPRAAETLAPGEGGVVLYENRRAGAYRDLDGRLCVVDTTCTHLGCVLRWNAAEKSWDCPCHGGRFSAWGARLEGPPARPLRVLKQVPGTSKME